MAEPITDNVVSDLRRKAYVGVCSGDKELTDSVLPIVRRALREQEGTGA